jgi:hypothetical protein
MINHPPHYNAHPSGIECIQVTRLCGFSLGNAIKYVWRSEHKNGAEDLKKARFYLQDVLDNGAPHYLPWKAKHLLRQVCDQETNPARRHLFNHLIFGELEAAINHISLISGP